MDCVEIEELSQRAAEEFPKSEGTDLGLRLRRATSWLQKACKEERDPASQFCFCFVAFNAAYGVDSVDERERTSEAKQRSIYFEKIARLQKRYELHHLVRDDLKEQVHQLLDNKYVYMGYWKYELGNEDRNTNYPDFESALDKDKQEYEIALKKYKTKRVLEILFFRLNTLRNQLLHGSATWDGSLNSSQVECGREIVSLVIPKMIEIMMLGRDKDWSNPSYPPTFMLN